MKKKTMLLVLAALLAMFCLAGCGNTAEDESAAQEGAAADQFEATTVYLSAANSMSDAMDEVIALYNEQQPNVTVTPVYDSSGTLLAQIQEAGGCDVFFSAAQKQMDALEADGLIVDGTRHNVVNNQLIVMTYKDSNTKVTGLETLGDAESLAIPGGTVPAGNYTRKALMAAGILGEAEDSAAITSDEISQALGGVTINECENVGAAAQAVSEASNEAGTCYYSDFVKYTNQGFDLEVIEKVSQELTGDIIYPICQVVNEDADELETKAALDFLTFCMSDEAKAIYEKYGFDINVE
ncbi:MAG: molybdate ABC transporter substrate-binding protein [Bacillota bacterium]|jgi:molybdate transport system substrate-binding protein